MDFARGQIVRSLAGHDEGNLYFVIDVAGDYLLLADGKTRKMNHPKRKRHKHAAPAGDWDHPIMEKLRSGKPPVSDREIRSALAAFQNELSSVQGGNMLGKKRYD